MTEKLSMQHSDKGETKMKQFVFTLASGLRLLSEICKFREGDKLTPEKIKAYEFALKDLSPRTLEQGIRIMAKEAIYFPTPAEIRNAGVEEVRRLNGIAEQRLLDNAKAAAVKAERFMLGSDEDAEAAVEKRREEFQSMLKEAGLR